MSNLNNATSMSMIVTKGTLDWAYPPFILATTAAAMGLEVSMFFTFYGLGLLRKDLNLKITPIGNPAMEMPMMGTHIAMPNLLAAMPGASALATGMMKNMIACQMTMDLFEYKLADMIEGPDLGGAATFIEMASKSDINLYI